MLPGCCPSCGFAGEIEAFFIEPEAKRAIARVAALDPAIGKVIGPYLRLFGTGKRGVQLRRAVKLIDDLVALVETGEVCRDERGGVRRAAPTAMWASGIEQMTSTPPSGSLQNHHYLRAIVFGIADQADAQAERKKESEVRQRPRAKQAGQLDPVQEAIAYARQMLAYQAFTQEQHDDHIANARRRHE